jgi:hypothetical protein
MELPESVLNEMAARKLEGESYNKIRKELAESGLEGDELRKVMRMIDELVLKEEMNRKAEGRTRQWYWAGVILASVGLVLTLGSNRGIILANVPRWIVYSPFFGGIALMLYSRYSGRRRSETEKEGPGPIRRKRPYK